MKTRYVTFIVLVVGIYFSAPVTIYPKGKPALQSASSVSALGNGKWKIWLSPNDKWFDTKITFVGGTGFNISATGAVTWAPPGGRDMSPTVGPKGTRPPFEEDKNRFPVPQAGCGSLVMRVGKLMYSVGEGGRVAIGESGTIQLMVNDDNLADNSGGFSISIEVPQSTQDNIFRRPIQGGSIACPFDSTTCYDVGKYHTAIDYWGEGGKETDILASNCGTVRYISRNNGKDHGLGNAVILEHYVFDTGVGGIVLRYSLYAHLSSIDPNLTLNHNVANGERLGVMGSTGYGKPDHYGKKPHLHFEVKTANILSNSAGKGPYWGYTPKTASGFGFIDPAGVIGNWRAICFAPDPEPSTNSVLVSAASRWIDTGIEIKAAQRLTIAASGTINTQLGYRRSNSDANGQTTICNSPNCIMRGLGFGTLVGRIGDGQPFRVGANFETTATSSGKLYLTVNDTDFLDNSRSFMVRVETYTLRIEAMR